MELIPREGGSDSARRDFRVCGTRPPVCSPLLQQAAQGLGIGKMGARDAAKWRGSPAAAAGLVTPGGGLGRGRDRC
jgi:hypothetical protein